MTVMKKNTQGRSARGEAANVDKAEPTEEVMITVPRQLAQNLLALATEVGEDHAVEVSKRYPDVDRNRVSARRFQRDMMPIQRLQNALNDFNRAIAVDDLPEPASKE